MEASQVQDQRPQRLGHRVGFVGMAVILLGLMAAAGALSPLYSVFQREWGFSTGVLTLVFAVYALTLLAALLTVGGLSDHIGRRPVLIASLVLAAVSMVMFLLADSPGWLLAGRAVQGAATGAATGAVTAALVELQSRPSRGVGAVLGSIGTPAGVALGGLIAGLALRFLSAPATVLFTGFIILFLVLAALTFGLPETSPLRPGALASLQPRIGVPPEARPLFLRSAAATVAAWSLTGLYLSLGPSLASTLLHLSGGLAGGVVVAAFAASGAAAGVLLRGREPRTIMSAGLVVLAIGATVAVVALTITSTWLFFAGAVVGGAGFGSVFFGAFGALAAVRTARRAELSAAFYIASYLAMSLPAMLAGVLVPAFGLEPVVIGYAGLVVLLSLGVALASANARIARRPA